MSGFLGWIVWLFVHLAFLTGFKNRFKTLISWMLSFIGGGRTERAPIFTRYDRATPEKAA